MYKTNIRKLKGGEKNANGLRISGPKQQRSSELPGFPFCLIFLRPGAEETISPEMPTETDKISPKKSLISLALKPGKGWPSKIENFETVTALLWPNSMGKNAFHLTFTSKGLLGILHSPSCNEIPQSPPLLR